MKSLSPCGRGQLFERGFAPLRRLFPFGVLASPFRKGRLRGILIKGKKLKEGTKDDIEIIK
jgi:hypothetical protein